MTTKNAANATTVTFRPSPELFKRLEAFRRPRGLKGGTAMRVLLRDALNRAEQGLPIDCLDPIETQAA
jgi:hypothetical protein